DEVVIVGRSGYEWKSASPGSVRVLAYGLHLGARLPAHATSTGRVLLAAQGKTAFTQWLKGRSLPRLTPRTVIDLRQFRGVIEQVRADDFSLAVEEHELGVHALAVPLRNMQGKTVASLNVVASPQRLSAQIMQQDLLPLLLDAARELRPLL
ncbi:MAG: IclR family transcriptional regulator, partial [Haliea sp.]